MPPIPNLCGQYTQIGNILRKSHHRAEDPYRPPSQPTHILECRALLELYHDLRTEHTAWVQRIHATWFHRGLRG